MEYADLIVLGERPFAVRNGRFARAERGPKTEVIDCSGKMVMPGLIDAHIHLTGMGLDLQCANLVGASSMQEIVARMRAFADASADEWLLGNGWDQNLFAGKGWPTHHALSEAFPNRPVVLRRIDCHALLVNAAAMAVAGIDPESHSGIFIDNDMPRISRYIPSPSHDRLVRALKAAVKECNQYG